MSNLGFIGLAVLGYFGLLALIARWTASKTAGNNQQFFLGGQQSPWFLVAFGMVGASLSGVTFISVPGAVGLSGGNAQFAYLQMVLGYVIGYWLIATVLLPLYYRRRLTSIYGYLAERYGPVGQRTGAAFFLLSRSLGAALRLYLTTAVLHQFLVEPLTGLPFVFSAALSLALIWVYTRKGGLRTVVYTDVLQTSFMILAALGTAFFVWQQLGSAYLDQAWAIGPTRMFFFDDPWTNPNFFGKQFLAGVFICLAMTGLDQDMMQKNLSCRSLAESQKNMYWFSVMQLVVNALFLVLGFLLWAYGQSIDLHFAKADLMFPTLAFEHMPLPLTILFVLGLVAAAYSSADSAITALTTSFCMDFLGFKSVNQGKLGESPKSDQGILDEPPVQEPQSSVLVESEQESVLRRRVHLGFSLGMFVLLMLFYWINHGSVISLLFSLAGFTYGPLLGLFAFGLLSRRQAQDGLIPLLALLSMLVGWIIQTWSVELFWGYKFGFETLILNALLMMLGLRLTAKSV